MKSTWDNVLQFPNSAEQKRQELFFKKIKNWLLNAFAVDVKFLSVQSFDGFSAQTDLPSPQKQNDWIFAIKDDNTTYGWLKVSPIAHLKKEDLIKLKTMAECTVLSFFQQSSILKELEAAERFSAQDMDPRKTLYLNPKTVSTAEPTRNWDWMKDKFHLKSRSVVIFGSQPEDRRKAALDIHEKTARPIFLRIQDLDRKERWKTNSWCELLDATLYIDDLISGSQAEIENILEYLSRSTSEDRPGLILGCSNHKEALQNKFNLSLKDLDRLCQVSIDLNHRSYNKTLSQDIWNLLSSSTLNLIV